MRTRTSPLYIVDNVMTLQELQNEEIWRLGTLALATANVESTLQWCARRSLIKNTMTCTSCLKLCRLHKKRNKMDGYIWACTTCNFRKAVREGSIFSSSRLKTHKILIIMYMWCCDYPCHQMARESRVGISNMISKWCSCLSEECRKWLENHNRGIGDTDGSSNETVINIERPKSAFRNKFQNDDFFRNFIIAIKDNYK